MCFVRYSHQTVHDYAKAFVGKSFAIPLSHSEKVTNTNKANCNKAYYEIKYFRHNIISGLQNCPALKVLSIGILKYLNPAILKIRIVE